ncbi:MAG: cupin-like domain-containing protein [Pseudomonadota bacterium]
MQSPTPIREWRDVTANIFHAEIMPLAQPAVLRGLLRDWPAVTAAIESPAAIANYLRGFDTGAMVDTMYGDPAIRGHFFYNDELTGHNFERRPAAFAHSLAQLLALLDEPAPPSIYAGAVPTPSSLPGFTRDNSLAFIDPSIVPRIWIGNRVTVPAHYDLSLNVACVVAGRRRFTLFPPEQLVNLYVGPLEYTLAGQPISMVQLDRPDYERYPKFREALAEAQSAELEPGDALFIPYMWWHHIESLAAFNVLVNYWWDDQPAWNGSPFEVLLHGLMAIRALPPPRREIWRKVFDHYVFQTGGDPVAHLTQPQRGIQGTPSAQLAEIVRKHLVQILSRRRW